jgi:hypothetical protein
MQEILFQSTVTNMAIIQNFKVMESVWKLQIRSGDSSSSSVVVVVV